MVLQKYTLNYTRKDFIVSEYDSIKLIHLEINEKTNILDEQSIRLDTKAYDKKREFLKNKKKAFGIEEPSYVEENSNPKKLIPTGKLNFFDELPENEKTSELNGQFAGDVLKLITGNNTVNIRKEVKFINSSTEELREKEGDKKAFQKVMFDRLWDELSRNIEGLK